MATSGDAQMMVQLTGQAWLCYAPMKFITAIRAIHINQINKLK
jgi:hypothetical protein